MLEAPMPTFLLSLAVLGCPAPTVQPAVATDGPLVRVIAGPWEAGTHLSLVATGPRTLEEAASGPTIVLASWVQDGKVWFSSSLNRGRGWSRPVQVAADVDTSADGTVGPELALGQGRTLLAFSQGGVPVLAQRDDYDWVLTPLEGRSGTQLELEVIDGDPWMAWVDGSGDLLVWSEQGVDAVSAAPGVCSSPALGQNEDGLPVVAWRQQDGAVRIANYDQSWSVDPQVGPGAVATGCRTDGPSWDGTSVLVADGQLIRDGVVLDSPEAGWDVSSAMARGGVHLWVEAKEATRRIRIEETALLSREGPLNLGAPVVVAGEIWIPFQTENAVVAAWSP